MTESYTQSMFNLTGKTVVVTGGGGVLCSTISVALAAAGARVAVMDLFLEKAQQVTGQIAQAGGQPITMNNGAGQALAQTSVLAANGSSFTSSGW